MPNRRGVTGDQSTVEKLARVDFAGGVLIGSCIAAFLLPFELAGTAVPWNHPIIGCCFVGSLVLGVLTVRYETCWAEEPIISPKLLFSWDILIPNLANFCQAAAQLGVRAALPNFISGYNTEPPWQSLDDVHCPFYFQVTQGSSSAVAGAHLLPAPVGVTIGGLIGGYMTRR